MADTRSPAPFFSTAVYGQAPAFSSLSQLASKKDNERLLAGVRSALKPLTATVPEVAALTFCAHAGAEPSIDQKLTRVRCAVYTSVNQAASQASSGPAVARRPMIIVWAQLEGKPLAAPHSAESNARVSPPLEISSMCAAG